MKPFQEFYSFLAHSLSHLLSTYLESHHLRKSWDSVGRVLQAAFQAVGLYHVSYRALAITIDAEGEYFLLGMNQLVFLIS